MIVIVDWLTPAGIVVGILLGLPIIATALSDDTRAVGIVTGVAAIGFLVAAHFGSGPISPAVVWAPNRIFAFLTLPASLLIAILLQRARLRAAAEREQAARASDLNRLLLSLLAHDMRSPLSMAVQAMEYIRLSSDTGTPADPTLVSDVEQRLRRGLSAIDRTLAFSQPQVSDLSADSDMRSSGRSLLTDLEVEARSFEAEAAAHGKRLDVRFSAGPEDFFRTDPLLARQALAILVDNAVRHAVEGSIQVSGEIVDQELRVMVADDGPGSAMDRGQTAGSGIGLALCRALIARAGGDLTLAADSHGTSVLLRLPLISD